MKRYRLTPAAQEDLSEIWDFTEERWDASQAETYIAGIRAAIERIAGDPVCGLDCEEIRPGYRRLAVGRHLVFYLETGETVDIIRILHQRMDPGRHL